ncbi:MAG: D-tyrosyl-tRNA(Tyr) deacylase [Anaerolineaceae bacterium]|nr:MAG: D-tyrosyl-tRNA(Tyr) deacylase [Anaerolineaceae bacterium]
MRIVIQRVLEAKVEVKGKTTGQIGRGFLIFLGVGKDDDKNIADRYIDKILRLRIFADDMGKTNLSLKDVQGEVLLVSQFTLYADCRKGNRPDFINAGSAGKAEELYEYFLEQIKDRIGRVESGEFGAEMKVSLVNDGPFTIILDEHMI